MNEIVFKAERQIDSRTYILKETTLTIIGEVGLERERTIRLRDISPGFLVFTKRLKRFYLVPLSLSIILGVTAWCLMRISDNIIVTIAAGIAGVLALGFLLAIKLEPIESAEFINNQGVVEFCIFRPFKSAHTYDEFLAAVVHRINRSREIIP